MSETDIYTPRITRHVRVLAVRGVDYNINEWGDPKSPLLVFLHGWADAGSTFQFVVDKFSREWFVVAPDWRGFGRTNHHAEGYWFPDYLADLHEILENYSHSLPVTLIGHSMGANIAMLYAGAFPERVQTIVNIEGYGLPDSDPKDAPQNFRNWIEAGRAKATFSEYASFAALARRIKKSNPLISDANAGFVAREWASDTGDGIIRLRADPRHKWPNAVLYRRAEAEACWKKISARILLVSGGGSAFPGFFEGTPMPSWPDSRAVVIERAGHMVHFEAAAALAVTIENYL